MLRREAIHELARRKADEEHKRKLAFTEACRKVLARAARQQQRAFVVGAAFVDAFWTLRGKP
jgi:hypothetical protein